MPVAELGSTSLHYETTGAGSPCLVVHGGPGLHHGLYRSLDPLGRTRTLVYWDQRGHGRSGPLPSTVEMRLFADDAVALADHLGLGPFAVLGHSFGGWVAQELALSHPERVSALVLVATTPGQLGTTEPPGDDQGPPPPAEVSEIMGSRPETGSELIELYHRLAPHFMWNADPETLRRALDPDLVSATAMVRVMEALAGWSSVDRLRGIRCPTLVIGGRHDVFCSPAQLERIARRIASAELHWFEQSGHFPWLEEGDRFFDMVGTWLRSH